MPDVHCRRRGERAGRGVVDPAHPAPSGRPREPKAIAGSEARHVGLVDGDCRDAERVRGGQPVGTERERAREMNHVGCEPAQRLDDLPVGQAECRPRQHPSWSLSSQVAGRDALQDRARPQGPQRRGRANSELGGRRRRTRGSAPLFCSCTVVISTWPMRRRSRPLARGWPCSHGLRHGVALSQSYATRVTL